MASRRVRCSRVSMQMCKYGEDLNNFDLNNANHCFMVNIRHKMVHNIILTGTADTDRTNSKQFE